MNKIKNIIFDLGNVLLDIDFTKTVEAFEKLGLQDFKSRFSLTKMDSLFEDLETGKISEDFFYKSIQSISTKPITATQIKNAWNALILNFREDSLLFLKKISPTYKLYLLSNTNCIHLTAVKKIFKNKTGLQNFDDYFIKAYYSNNIGLRKPAEEIYTYVLNDAKLIAAETLFIDDLEINTNAAKSVGLYTHLLLPHQKIEDLKIINHQL